MAAWPSIAFEISGVINELSYKHSEMSAWKCKSLDGRYTFNGSSYSAKKTTRSSLQDMKHRLVKRLVRVSSWINGRRVRNAEKNGALKLTWGGMIYETPDAEVYQSEI